MWAEKVLKELTDENFPNLEKQNTDSRSKDNPKQDKLKTKQNKTKKIPHLRHHIVKHKN
jgi:hypothetical protein